MELTAVQVELLLEYNMTTNDMIQRAIAKELVRNFSHLTYEELLAESKLNYLQFYYNHEYIFNKQAFSINDFQVNISKFIDNINTAPKSPDVHIMDRRNGETKVVIVLEDVDDDGLSKYSNFTFTWK